MTDLVGVWKYDSADKAFDDYLKAIGIGYINRKLANAVAVTLTITRTGDEWTVSVASTFKNAKWSFRIGEKAVQETIDGRKFLVTMLLEDGKVLIESQEACVESGKNIPSEVRRYVNEDGLLVAECRVDDIVARRYFKKVA